MILPSVLVLMLGIGESESSAVTLSAHSGKFGSAKMFGERNTEERDARYVRTSNSAYYWITFLGIGAAQYSNNMTIQCSTYTVL